MQAQNAHQPLPAHYGDHHEAGNPPEGDPRGYQQHAVNTQQYQAPSTAPHGYSSAPPQQPYAAGAYPGSTPAFQAAPHFPPQQFAAPPQFPPQPQPFPVRGPPQAMPQGVQSQLPTMDFPPPPNLPPVRDNFINGAGQFLEPGEQVYYGFILKLDDTIEETPRDLAIAIEGRHHALGEINRASRKVNRGMKWATDPMGAVVDKLVDKGNEALNKKLAGPVFLGGWTSQAGWFIRYLRATAEDYGPGAYGAITSRRYLIFRAARLGGSDMRLVYAVPRTTIAGVRLEGTKNAAMHGRTPRAELHFADGSMVATMMPTKSGEQLAAILQVQTQARF